MFTRVATRRGCQAAVMLMVLAGCAGGPPTVREFLSMSSEDRQSTWQALSPTERKVLRCKVEAWKSYTDRYSGIRSDITGPVYWAGTNASWTDYATGVVPGSAACNQLRDAPSEG